MRGTHGDALEVLVPSAPATLDPRYATDAVGIRVSRLVHAGLVQLDPTTLEPVPYVARELAWEGASRLRVALRSDVRFASGAPLEPEDVCATLRAFADPALASPHRVVAASIATCEGTGPRELVLTLGEPRATLMTDLEVPILRRDQARLPPQNDGKLDGLGPYAVRAFDEGATLLAARDGGALPRPAHDLAIRVVHDENARALRLIAGRADVVPNALSPTSLASLAREGAHVVRRPGANLTYLLTHDARGPFATAKAREGLAKALDREALARTLLGGYARVADGFLPKESWAAPPAAPIAFAPDEARALLAAAGVTRFTLLVSSDRARGTMARAIAQMLGDVGVAVEVVPLELGVLLHRLSAGDFELALLQIPELTEPNVLRWFFHSSAIPGAGAGANRARYANALVDAELDRASRDPDRAVRRAAYELALGQMQRDLAVVPLFHEDQIAALSTRARGFVPSAEGRWLDLARVR